MYRVTLAASVLAAVLTASAGAQEFPRARNGQDKNCLACHGGIESIGAKMDELSCVACHKGMGKASVWKKVTDVTGFAKTDKEHAKILQNFLPKR